MPENKLVKVTIPYDKEQSLKKIVAMVIMYHDALRNREHGDVAAHKLVGELQSLFGMQYDQFTFYHQ